MLLLLYLLSTGYAGPRPSPVTDDVPNPDRGLNTTLTRDAARERAAASPQAQGVVQYNLDLGGFCTRSLPDDALARLAADLDAHRAVGATVLFRAAYTFGRDSARWDPCRKARRLADRDTRRDVGNPATIDVALTHIHQLAPILNRYVDVVAVVQTGMLGLWGEGHHGPRAASVEAVDRVVQAWHTDLDPALPLSVRRPQYLPGGTDDRSDLPGRSVWFHNDGLLNGDDEDGTWIRQDRTPRATRSLDDETCRERGASWRGAWKDQVAAYLETPGVTLGGEANGAADDCHVSPDWARQEMASMGLTFLTGSYQQAVHARWSRGCDRRGDGMCFRKEVARRVGYRLHIVDEPLLTTDTSGLTVRLRLSNTGFDAPVRDWPLYVQVGEGPLVPASAPHPSTSWHREAHISGSVAGPHSPGTPVWLVIGAPAGPTADRVCLARGPWDHVEEGHRCDDARRNRIGLVPPPGL